MKQSYTLLIQFLIALTLSASLTAQNEFITTWKTDNPGTSNATSITIPTAASGYNYDVDWENDGTWDDFGVTGDITHDYGIIGTRTVAIRGTFPRIYFNNSGDRQKLLEVNQWGTIAWSTMTRAFAGCENLKISAPDAPNLTFVTNLIQMFQNATYLLGDISGWNVSNITNMSNMFDNATFFDGDLSSWDVSAVTNMNNMLRNVTLSTTNYENILIGWNSQTLQNGVSFHGGNSQYCSVAATNARANIMASDSWIITDGGTIPPTAACIVTPFTLYLNASGNATLDPNDVDNGSILNCAGTLGLSLSKTAFTCANLGSNSVTLTVDDGNGNTDTCTATVEVVDNINPTASNPADINVQCLGDVPAADITVVTDEADNCGTPTVAFVSQTANPAINNGTITRTYSVTDASGNSINVSQDINILDNTDPTASNPADINVQCLGDVPATDITVVTDEADNCGTPTVAFVSQTA
ncbi:BspA family leucine-rich repeat surface protein, partial [Winogradskyella thalassocola]